MPGGKPGSWYLPSPPVTDARCAPVCVLMAVIWASGTPAREASVTVPEIDPEVVCATTGIMNIQHAMIGTSSASIRFITTRTISLESAVGLTRSHHEADLTRRGIHQNVGRLHILHESAPFCATRPVPLRDRRRSVRMRHLHPPWKESIERLAARVLERERRLPAVLGEGQRLNRPG